MEFRKPNTGKISVKISQASTNSNNESQNFSKNSQYDWINCSVKSKVCESESLLNSELSLTSQIESSKYTQISVANLVENGNKRKDVYFNDLLHSQKRIPLSDIAESNFSTKIIKGQDISDDSNSNNTGSINFQNTETVKFIYQKSEQFETAKKLTANVISNIVNESSLKKLLHPYKQRHSVNEKSVSFLQPTKTRLPQSVSAPVSPFIHSEPSSSNAARLERRIPKENTSLDTLNKHILKRSSAVVRLLTLTAALGNEKGPRKEAPFFISSLCQGLLDVLHCFRDDLSEENEDAIVNAASLIADLTAKDVKTPNSRGYSLHDMSVVTLVKSVLNCIGDKTYVSQYGGSRNNLVHSIFRSLIKAAEIRRVIFDNICHAISCSFNVISDAVQCNSLSHLIPTSEMDSLFRYFQLLTMVLVCSTAENWIEESDLIKLKALEIRAILKLPFTLITVYLARIIVLAKSKLKKPV